MGFGLAWWAYRRTPQARAYRNLKAREYAKRRYAQEQAQKAAWKATPTSEKVKYFLWLCWFVIFLAPIQLFFSHTESMGQLPLDVPNCPAGEFQNLFGYCFKRIGPSPGDVAPGITLMVGWVFLSIVVARTWRAQRPAGGKQHRQGSPPATGPGGQATNAAGSVTMPPQTPSANRPVAKGTGKSSSGAMGTSTGLGSTSQEVVRFEGSGTQNTRPFSITGPWELGWNAASFTAIDVYAGEDRVDSVLQPDGGVGASYVRSSGTLYLKIISAGHWAVTVTRLDE